CQGERARGVVAGARAGEQCGIIAVDRKQPIGAELRVCLPRAMAGVGKGFEIFGNGVAQLPAFQRSIGSATEQPDRWILRWSGSGQAIGAELGVEVRVSREVDDAERLGSADEEAAAAARVGNTMQC